MARPEDLPLELWKDILDYLDNDLPAADGLLEASGATPDIPLKTVSVVSKFLRSNSLAVLFKYMKIQQYYSERKIKKGQDAVLTTCLDFIKQNGLKNHITCLSLGVVIDEKRFGKADKRSADWPNDRKDWHVHRQTARIFEVINPQTFRLLVYNKWKHTELLNALYLYQDVKLTTDSNIQSDILLHQKPWCEIQLLSLPQSQYSSVHYSMLEFNRRTPSLLKPLILRPHQPSYGSYRPSRVQILPKDTPKMEFPGLIANLTKFTYLTIGKPPYPTNTNQVDEDRAVATFLATNCPNLQYLRVRLTPSRILSSVAAQRYYEFTRVILAKPNMKTPKLFIGLDLKMFENVIDQSHCQILVSEQLVGWKSVGLGEFYSFIGEH